jgi:hypothetical protein
VNADREGGVLPSFAVLCSSRTHPVAYRFETTIFILPATNSL